MIRAVIFDMDGLLIDSEPLWLEAEMQVLQSVGVPLKSFTQADTTGLRNDETVEYWFHRYPWSGPSLAEVGAKIDKKVIELIREKGEPKEGVNEVISVCQNLGLQMAVASSSSLLIMKSVMTKLGLNDVFRIVRSAETEMFGKPHPAVYINTAEQLGVDRRSCVAVEDSINGVVSAKAASMYCIAVPEPGLRHDKRFGIADHILDSLLHVKGSKLQALD